MKWGCFLGYALHQADDALLYLSRGEVLTRQPDEGDGQLTTGREDTGEQLLVQAEGFAHLPLHAVAVYGVLEVALGHADEYLEPPPPVPPEGGMIPSGGSFSSPTGGGREGA